MTRATTRLPWLIPATTAVLVLLGCLFAVAAGAAETGYLVLDAVVGVSYPLVGAMIASHRPRNPVGWLFCLSGAGLALQAFTGGYALLGAEEGWPLAALAAWVSNWVFFLGFGPLLLLPVLVPDGRLPSPRWRPVLRVLVALLVVVQVMLMFRDELWVWGRVSPNPVGFLSTDAVIAPAFGVLVVALAVAAVAALSVRLRRPRGNERRQLVPVLAAVGILALAVVADALLPPLSPLGIALLSTALPLVPIAVALSMFRYRLFEIEIYLRRTVVYAVVGVVLLALYLLVVTTLHALLGRQTDVVVQLVGTAIVAVTFAPLRDAVQRAVARLLFGSRGDPARALSDFGRRLEASADAGRLVDDAAHALAATLRLPGVEIADASGRVLSRAGAVPARAHELPLTAAGRAEGTLRVAPRSAGEQLSAGDLAVLDELARQLGVALAAVRLGHEVQQSREQLVVAREEERRLLRRELHDGLGPGLAAIGLGLDVAQAKAGRDVGLDGVRQLTRSLVADVRRIVHDLRPASLDELGLLGALEDLALAASGAQIVVEGDREALQHLPAAVEVAAYRIAQEALGNALKHSGASAIAVRVEREPHALVVTVTDDGVGVPAAVTEGVGSGSMRERAAELGGSLRREASAAGGTIVEAVLPL
ncbi:sensor histidine kinase [Herbiconiux sp. SYSU D00978]|uniref:sensor histidine kinase n=1 Tax=Herbiconiux sp. SYSU D00978 TaxID=2812562 RepID=UPI001A96F291|nr:ATP-binding protein [Herbiconiux sp. SYSU D00978]